MAGFYVSWYQLLTYKNGTYRWFGQGPHEDHGSDWRGMNFHHGRVPDCPAFTTTLDAVNWLVEQWTDVPTHMRGHHSGVYSCSKGCDDREVPTLGCVYSRRRHEVRMSEERQHFLRAKAIEHDKRVEYP